MAYAIPDTWFERDAIMAPCQNQSAVAPFFPSISMLPLRGIDLLVVLPDVIWRIEKNTIKLPPLSPRHKFPWPLATVFRASPEPMQREEAHLPSSTLITPCIDERQADHQCYQAEDSYSLWQPWNGPSTTTTVSCSLVNHTTIISLC